MNIVDKILKVEPTGIDIGPSKIIISAPFMHDYFFGRSVVLLLEHNEEGSMGFILNKPTTLYITDMLEGFEDISLPIFMGGPVQTDNIFFIHNRPDLIDNSVRIYDNLYWGGNYKQLRTFMNESLIQTNEIMFFLGYSGWEKDQLEDELKNETWIVSNKLSFDSIINTRPEHIWENAVKSCGNKYSHWLKFPKNPNNN